MNEWFEFTLYAVSSLVSAVFDWDLGIGISVGDFCLALAVLAIVAGALVVKSSHISSGVDIGPRDRAADDGQLSLFDSKGRPFK